MLAIGAMLQDFENNKEKAQAWFKALRDKICAAFEAEETKGQFEKTDWVRRPEGGGGTMALMRGEVFEKVGVNISTVHGEFSEAFRKQIPGAEENGGAFWASGISLVAHMRNPFVPAVHMNTRMIVTSKGWFGGGTDLNPAYPQEEDTKHFHETLQQACERYAPTAYDEYKKWCDEYFYIPHRNEARGVGGIFFDYLDSGDWSKDFAFVQDVGEAFLKAYIPLVQKNKNKPYTDEHRAHLKFRRGRYAEFNLVYDRGTQFGLKTGGNVDAILMSLPPDCAWP
ncbi:MAG: oxygen-dependent coproporphyrinogen oxidase [Alphaproteobacteria bacterium]|nr:oxygen-dependent coproporphyrinogen oxidase [Alphaproteobacteria bacterium]